MQARDQLEAENDGFTTFQTTFLNIPTTLEVRSDMATWADSTGHRYLADDRGFDHWRPAVFCGAGIRGS
jgi:hypothetical protein